MQSQQLAQTNAALSSERTERAASDSALAQHSVWCVAMSRSCAVISRRCAGVRREDHGSGAGPEVRLPGALRVQRANVRTGRCGALDRFANVVQKHYTGAKVTVEGFADPAGSTRYNLALSQRRADAVKAYRVREEGSTRR